MRLLRSAALGKPKRRPVVEPHVVVATLDTGFNPFHPTWRRDQNRHPSTLIPGYPQDAQPLTLQLDGAFADNVATSASVLAEADFGAGHYWIPGTNVVGLWASEKDTVPVFDPAVADDPDALHSHDHGASASSQIAGQGYGMAPGAFLVVVDRTPDKAGENVYEVNARGLRWAADQPWIDVIHTNIQNPVPAANSSTPSYTGFPDAVRYALDRGKVVVSAGGNFWVEPTETSPHAGPSGVLVAGANDNCGYTDYSNPNPHVVMDGYSTVAAAPDGDGDATFGGTSSSSPRTTGYVAQLLLELRRHYGYSGGIEDGSLLSLPAGRAPATGPLADGRLSAAELHEVVRKTALPHSHDSQWDGGQDLRCLPELPTPSSFYPKMGYGEVSEHTISAAFDVLTGAEPLPERPSEDQFYEWSEDLRRAVWD